MPFFLLKGRDVRVLSPASPSCIILGLIFNSSLFYKVESVLDVCRGVEEILCVVGN